MDPWLLELIVVRAGSHSGTERRALSRDVAQGRLHRLRQGVYADAGAWTGMDPEAKHILAMRALAAVSSVRPVFSHWSAAVALNLPVLRARLQRVHVTTSDEALRGRTGVAGHDLPLSEEEVVLVGGLLVTGVARTVVDIAAAAPFEDGVMVADGALFAGLPRARLEEAVALIGPRRALPRIEDVVAFAHPGAESANESRSRVTEYRLGVEPPELQHEIRDEQGFVASVDEWWEEQRAIGEADGARKYLDARLTKGDPGRVVHEEKKREDRARARADGLAR